MKHKSEKIIPQGSFQVKSSVKLYPELSAAALKAGLKKELALWYELRAINSNGSSRLVRKNGVAGLVEDFGYTQSTAYRLLNDGDGKLWDIKRPPPTQSGSTPSGSRPLGDNSASSYRLLRRTAFSLPVVKGVPKPTAPFSGGQGNCSTKEWHSTIKLYGLERVAEDLGVSGVGRLVEVPASVFRGRGVKNAWLYASFFKSDGSKGKPISRDSIKAATGVLRRQQQRYDKVAGIKRVANFAFQEDGKGKLTPILDLVEGKCKAWWKHRRLGNSYHSRALKAHRGMTKKVNAELRHRSLKRDEASCVPKRFFLSAKSLLKCHHKGPEAFLLVSPGKRLIKGRLEWCLV